MPLASREGLPDVTGGAVLSVSGEPMTAEEVISPVYERLMPLAAQADYEGFRSLEALAVEQVLRGRVAEAVGDSVGTALRLRREGVKHGVCVGIV